MNVRIATVLASFGILLGIAPASTAQVSTGRIDASVADSSAAVLPGTSVEISGPQDQSAVTDALGEAHFLNLAPGVYTLRARRTGFSDYLNRNVVVATGAGATVKISLLVAGIATQVQVTNEAPVVDTTRTTMSINVGLDELQNVPSSRDPWVVLQTIPGVMVDRVNVGGAESGQQSNYQAKGASGSDNTWNIDGIAVTDMAATGSTPTYYDFDMFQEIQVTTGGADVTTVTPGVQLNLVLKSGSNRPRGSSRFYFENQGLEWNNMPADLASTIGGTTGMGNRTAQYQDYGLELGGPLVKNRLWAWGAAGKTHVDLITLAGGHDRTELQDTALKLTGQIAPGIRTNFTYFRGNKEKFGRGADVTRPPETTWDQKGPTPLYKGEADFVLADNVFLSAKAARSLGGFSLIAEGGPNKNMWRDDGGVWHDTFFSTTTSRPQTSVSLDANTFRGHHELKAGFAWRKARLTASDIYPGNGIITQHVGYPEMFATVKRDDALNSDTVYASGYVGDTWTRDRLTVNAGLRWDRQAASLGASTVAASSALPALLPALTATPVKNAIVWNSVTPRVGATYALTEDRKTLLRGSYAMFASQLSSGAAGVISSIQPSGIYYFAVDANGNKTTDAGELELGLGNQGYYGFDPLNPTGSINQIGNYATPLTQEVVVGGERELFSNFGLSASFTYRYYNHFDWSSLIGVNSSNYRQTGTVSGSGDPIGSFNVPFYALDPAKVPPGGGRVFEERLGYHQRYLGFEASAVKRLSDKWMARFGFSTNSHREYFNGADALDDPTHSPGAPNINGGLVVTPTAGSGKSDIFMVLPRYQVVANGMYQTSWWGINLAGNWVLRQGYAEPFFTSQVSTGDPLANRKDVLLTPDAGAFRLPHVSSLDGRAEKAFRWQRAAIAVDFDVFNLTNSSAVLGRQYDTRLSGPTGFNQVLEIMNPRIARLGVRVSF